MQENNVISYGAKQCRGISSNATIIYCDEIISIRFAAIRLSSIKIYLQETLKMNDAQCCTTYQ